MADYFPRLPEPLTHHILSFLPFKEIGRTCVLSKYWNSIWCNYPNLDFYMVEKDVNNWAKENPEKALFDYVKNSFDKFLDGRPFIQKFCLQIECCTMGRGLTRKLDRWLRVSVNKNVARLVLRTKNLLSPFRYSVPQHVFIAQTLEVLDLFWCTLDTDCIVRIDLPRLELLSLSHCWNSGDKLLQKIVCGSPKSKHIVISWCQGGQPMHSISVPKLVSVAMRLEVLDLSVCTLEEHRFVGIGFPCLEKVFFKNCKFVGNNLLERILSACGPSMKHISISWCKGIGRSLSVSCKPLLKGFFLRCDDEFERIKIDAPSLRTFSYESTNAACVIDLMSCTNLENLYGSIGKSLNHPASALLLLHKI
ncbi:PREDICTED: F-box protein At5g03100-like isoform X2 [Ipomoea nil]|uniref:F-box protein At5g03100-like isoform X1 n=1 Tax=Ipomoea nil TaxID=35883 RepID=UPI0009014904|nr:PREDICTED: F-box protein At5g03100-like isoform X1 [Ipomoea nil]XP_019188200.1 PREDICTED: F-box protein At5g03100-like isoform X1 [Ipomoea nil]XP_019188201.1 PREDICTED: F-box protein At5g03100-like isoform X1 [Ipomoea nil]XP_019188202.1 PREDICTED: F-box protein At5g03100-like isoform X2 [Ipomoea nil]